MQPMSDRRFLAALVGALVAVVGAGTAVLAVLLLADPVQRTGDLGEPQDLISVAAAGIALGLLLLVAGAATAIRLVRSALRR